jgi:hypothetical protein
MSWYKSVGQIRCHKDDWLVIHTCEDMGRYYRRVFNWSNRFSSNGVVGDTKWGPHISLVRGEPHDPTWWQLYHLQEIEFEYNTVLRTNGKHLWFPVKCDEVYEIRKKLKLPPYPFPEEEYYGLHLTIGTYHRSSEDDPVELVIPKDLSESVE